MSKAAVCLFSLLALSACSGNDDSNVQGQDISAGPPSYVPPGVDPEVGTGCHVEDVNHICIALKYVVYKDPRGTPTVSSENAVKVVAAMNEVWQQCNISFQIERYLEVDPAQYGLSYQTANQSELTTIRQTFMDDHTLLLVTTGTWNRAGTLGNYPANAWTSLPYRGGGPFGAVLEKPVGRNGNLVAHELGHYLNLQHVGDENDVMNAIIYSKSLNLYDSQCASARSAAWYFWTRLLR